MKMWQLASASRSELEYSPAQWSPKYSPTHLTRVTRVLENGKVNIAVVIYFPKSYSPAAEQLENPRPPEEWCVQIKLDNGRWHTLNPPEPGGAYWSLELKEVSPGVRLQFRYKDSQGTWQSITPLSDLENVYGSTYVPTLTYKWKNQPPRFNHGKVLMETSLEGLLAGYKGGKLAPRSREEMFQPSIAGRILKTDIPALVAEWAVDELLVPVCSSVADRSYLDPKFNYLTYNVADVDWQIGQSRDFMRLVDRFYENSILIVPDLIFVHQVKNPFEGTPDRSLDRIVRSWDGEKLFVDKDAFFWRDYGTWMFKLADPEIRRQVIEKIVAFAVRFHLKMIRIDYVDGLFKQYSNRDENFGEIFIRELKAELRKVVPDLVVLGETFEFKVAGNPAVKDLIDIFYAPVGFSIVEELCKPPDKMNRPLYPEISHLVSELNRAAFSQRPEAIYTQLHDETWYDEHIGRGRPDVPWAYGSNPAELVKRQGEKLISMGLLQPENLLDYVRRTVRNAEALTMFTAKLRYMFVPTVDSLCLGGLDEQNNWKIIWDGVTPIQMREWKKTGLSERKIYFLHQQHRADMIKLRQIFRNYTKVIEETLQPVVQPKVYHVDTENSVLGLFRLNPVQISDSLIILFNLGARVFRDDVYYDYEVPVPEGFGGKWEVLFDGDWIAPQRRFPNEKTVGYQPGTVLETTSGQYLNEPLVLRLSIGAISLIVLKYFQGHR
ncbi:MAG: hypothetical protein AB4426_13170 [Xenococcaceae cyanobacterium]